jgi:PilZ domain
VERRSAPRTFGGVPVRIELHSGSQGWQSAILRDFSETGFYVYADGVKLAAGDEVSINLLVPLRLTEPVSVSCACNVVRLDALHYDAVGIAMQVFSFELPNQQHLVTTEQCACM